MLLPSSLACEASPRPRLRSRFMSPEPDSCVVSAQNLLGSCRALHALLNSSSPLHTGSGGSPARRKNGFTSEGTKTGNLKASVDGESDNRRRLASPFPIDAGAADAETETNTSNSSATAARSSSLNHAISRPARVLKQRARPKSRLRSRTTAGKRRRDISEDEPDILDRPGFSRPSTLHSDPVDADGGQRDVFSTPKRRRVGPLELPYGLAREDFWSLEDTIPTELPELPFPFSLPQAPAPGSIKNNAHTLQLRFRPTRGEAPMAAVPDDASDSHECPASRADPPSAPLAPQAPPATVNNDSNDYHDSLGSVENPRTSPKSDSVASATSPSDPNLSSWTTEDDRRLVALVLEKYCLSIHDWTECARRMGRGELEPASLDRRWHALVDKGNVGLTTTTCPASGSVPNRTPIAHSAGSVAAAAVPYVDGPAAAAGLRRGGRMVRGRLDERWMGR